MTDQQYDQVVYDFQYGERYPYQVIPARDIDRAQQAPGIYAWFLRVPPTEASPEKVLSYAQVFFSKTFASTARSFLREQYAGSLDRVPPLSDDEIAVSSLLYRASAVLSPPIYIGLSKNVRKRLARHLAELNRSLESSAGGDPADAAEENPSYDTDVESGLFGRRIAQVLRRQGVDDIRCLFLKILYQSDYDRQELRATEHFLNRVLVPVCGRK